MATSSLPRTFQLIANNNLPPNVLSVVHIFCGKGHFHFSWSSTMLVTYNKILNLENARHEVLTSRNYLPHLVQPIWKAEKICSKEDFEDCSPHLQKHDHGPSKSCCQTYAAAVSGKVCLTHQGCTLGTAIKAESAESAKLQT